MLKNNYSKLLTVLVVFLTYFNMRGQTCTVNIQATNNKVYIADGEIKNSVSLFKLTGGPADGEVTVNFNNEDYVIYLDSKGEGDLLTSVDNSQSPKITGTTKIAKVTKLIGYPCPTTDIENKTAQVEFVLSKNPGKSGIEKVVCSGTTITEAVLKDLLGQDANDGGQWTDLVTGKVFTGSKSIVEPETHKTSLETWKNKFTYTLDKGKENERSSTVTIILPKITFNKILMDGNTGSGIKKVEEAIVCEGATVDLANTEYSAKDGTISYWRWQKKEEGGSWNYISDVPKDEDKDFDKTKDLKLEGETFKKSVFFRRQAIVKIDSDDGSSTVECPTDMDTNVSNVISALSLTGFEVKEDSKTICPNLSVELKGHDVTKIEVDAQMEYIRSVKYQWMKTEDTKEDTKDEDRNWVAVTDYNVNNKDYKTKGLKKTTWFKRMVKVETVTKIIKKDGKIEKSEIATIIKKGNCKRSKESDIFKVNVIPKPELKVFKMTPDGGKYCADTDVTFDIQGVETDTYVIYDFTSVIEGVTKEVKHKKLQLDKGTKALKATDFGIDTSVGGTYTIKLKKICNENCCTTIDETKTIIIKEKPTLTKVEPSKTQVCEKEQVKVTLTGSLGATVTYDIDGNDVTDATITLNTATADPKIGTAEISINTSKKGTKKIKLKKIARDNCKFKLTDEKNIEVKETPKVIKTSTDCKFNPMPKFIIKGTPEAIITYVKTIVPKAGELIPSPATTATIPASGVLELPLTQDDVKQAGTVTIVLNKIENTVPCEASPNKTLSIEIKELPTGKIEPVQSSCDKTATIVINQMNGMEYSIDNDKWQDSNSFSVKAEKKDYYLYVRKKGTDCSSRSALPVRVKNRICAKADQFEVALDNSSITSTIFDKNPTNQDEFRTEKATADRVSVKITQTNTNVTIRADGKIVVNSGAVIGTHTLKYQLVDKADNTNISNEVSVTIKVENIEATDDDGGIINLNTGTQPTVNVFDNDLVSDDVIPTASMVKPTNSSVSLEAVGTLPKGITLNADGTVSVAQIMPTGEYSFEYKICKKGCQLGHSLCKQATYTLKVVGKVDAEDDVAIVSGGTEDTKVNILTGDTLYGSEATLENVSIKIIGNLPDGITADPNTGKVAVTKLLESGDYKFTYEICDKSTNPQGACDQATYTVRISNEIKAVDDSYDRTPPINKPYTFETSVLKNDTLGEFETKPNNVEISVGLIPKELEFDTATGEVTVKKGTKKGTYSFDYQICEKVGGTASKNCAMARVVVKVADEIEANTDDYGHISRAMIGDTTLESVLIFKEDYIGKIVKGKLEKFPVNKDDVIITVNGLPSDWKFNKETGEISFPQYIAVGGYQFSYTICQKDHPTGDNCSTAEVKVYVDEKVECLMVHNLFTPNGDGLNDVMKIRCIENHPNNKVEVFNRWGDLVYWARGYNNKDIVFTGVSQATTTIAKDTELPTGTYFVVVDLGLGDVVKSWVYLQR